MASLNGIQELRQRIEKTLIIAFSNGGHGEFGVEYEYVKENKYRALLKGTENYQFYVSDMELRHYQDRNVTESPFDMALSEIMKTIISAVNNAGYGGFKVKYARNPNGINRVCIWGTERHEFQITPEEVKARRLAFKMEQSV